MFFVHYLSIGKLCGIFSGTVTYKGVTQRSDDLKSGLNVVNSITDLGEPDSIFFAVKDIIEDRIGRKFICECQLLRDDRAKRRLELERIYGVDFSGMFGQRDFDVV